MPTSTDRRPVSARRGCVPKPPGMTAALDVPTDLANLHVLADETGLPLRMLRRWAYDRRLAVYRLGGTVYVSRADLGEFIAAGRIEPAAS